MMGERQVELIRRARRSVAGQVLVRDHRERRSIAGLVKRGHMEPVLGFPRVYRLVSSFRLTSE